MGNGNGQRRNGNGKKKNGRNPHYPKHVRSKAKELYVIHGVPIPEIEEKMAPDGPPLATLRNWCTNEGWILQRREYMQKASEEQEEEQRANIARERERILQFWRAAAGQAQRILVPIREVLDENGILRKMPGAIDANTLDSVTRSFSRIHQGLYSALGIKEDMPVEQNITIAYMPMAEIAEEVLQKHNL